MAKPARARPARLAPIGALLFVVATSAAALADDVSSRLVADTEPFRKPPSVRVTWIGWDSSFRGSALRISDRIVGVASPYLGESVRRLDEAVLRNGLFPGGYAEPTFWRTAEAQEGEAFDLIVLRDGREVSIPGTLVPERIHLTSSNRRALGDNGPDQMSTSGLSGKPWLMWYEDFTKKASFILDDAWNKNSGFNNRNELEEWVEANEQRVRFLADKHPGRFASTAVADYEAVRTDLEGAKVTVTAASQEWRRLGAQTIRLAKRAGLDRAAAVRQETPAQWARTFPAPHPITSNLARFTGRLIELPRLTEQDSTTDLGNTYFVVGSEKDGHWIVPGNGPVMDRCFDTYFQFKSVHAADLAMHLHLYAKVTSEAKMVAHRGRTVMALVVEPFAAYVGDRTDDLASAAPAPGYFVDLRQPPSLPVPGTSRLRIPFAGEETVPRADVSLPTADSTPGQVMAALIRAIQHGRQDLWTSLLADWDFYEQDPHPPVFHPQRYFTPTARRLVWDRARGLLTNFEDQLPDVVDARVSRELAPVRIFAGDAARGIPPIDEARVYVDHVLRLTPDSSPGAYDGEFRVFTSMYVKRVWRLQRLGPTAPWRVAELQAL